MTHPQNPFGNQQPRQYGNPVHSNTQSSFGGWGGGQQAYGQPLPQQQFAQQYQQGTGAFGPGYGAPGQFGPPPQKPAKKGPPAVLVGAVIGAGIALVALLIYAFVSGGSGEDGPDYRNEDYEVPTVTSSPPELPMPTTMGELMDMLEANAIYEQSFPVPVRCDIALDESTHNLSDEALEEHMTAWVECLTRAWGPTLEEAGFIAYQPRMTVYPAGGTVNTACGTAESLNAFYCGGDQNLYLARDLPDVLPAATAQERILFELVLAHEYGHAMQGRTGLFAASAILSYETEDDEDFVMELSRRTEVQADCFAGLALMSMTETLSMNEEDVAAMSRISFEIGDDQLQERFGVEDIQPGDHGIGENRALWIERGYSTPDISVCNSWTAPSSEVE